MVTTICRSCNAFCPIEVTIGQGFATNVAGNRNAPLFGGYTCPKGRALADLHRHPDRLMQSLKKQRDGSFIPISNDDLIGELAERLGVIIGRHGPRAVAAYLSGGVIEQPAASALMISFLEAIGSPMLFSASTIDQPGMTIGYALHGRWAGGRVRPENRDVFVIVGGNPINSKQYLPQNPGAQIKQMRRAGGKLVVIDPRRTETARLADIHLQPIPGEDPTILAGLIHLIIREGGTDRNFIERNATGFTALTKAVAPFTPDYVANRAGISANDLQRMAQVLIEARTGDVALGTGPSMATRGILSSYLALCVNTLRGFWAAEGDDAMHPSVLLPPRTFRAQPIPPYPAWGFGEKTRIGGFEPTPAGMPLAALPGEILMPGEGQVRALFLHGGALQSWPQHNRTEEALKALDLLVIHDVVLSPTAQLADFVIATKMQFELPAITVLNEIIANSGHAGYGTADPYAFCGPALVAPPQDADLMESWQTYYRVARHMGLPLKLTNWRAASDAKPALDMDREPSTMAIYELMCAGSAVPLDEVRRHPNGHVFEEMRSTVQPPEPGCPHRLQLADRDMLRELARVAREDPAAWRGIDARFTFQLIPGRMQNATNTFLKARGTLRWPYNPAFLHPSDIADLGIVAGDEVRITSRHGTVRAIVEEDAGLRRKVVALMHGFGTSRPDDDPRTHGTNVNHLTAWSDDFEEHTGMPRMGALPVSIAPSDNAASLCEPS
ncbi:molybdopterin-containing oxidoreductase family protein [Novosphingobium album (ex Hu et al. 2023)]|uniref:Molybdopterin-dependent oxidoreductase n=1 Tax=Novosphingobium album (ex Hu et al. 2023) TaxID=2930093 RepID=A0ABT0B824_9SPHN|nr:molybdopterin dinucleotide binding domain-containing protein [Novosphingobium album (ex Hu et al. 2023)]MCJ2181008.1 molybdopterin-dependent oxidoreductase [Novosphingobium album (ex Hu et al. 2023)]